MLGKVLSPLQVAIDKSSKTGFLGKIVPMLTLRSGIRRGPQGNISRRELLQIGSLSALGISLPQWLASQAAQGANRKGREVNCILLWLLGGPSHIDMYDLK
ncbi:MAG TPA: hypothetical protein EYN70_04290, partial [Planctomycetaceae bacterium]|nr:hypothetical protein [Planctomycetaceae bacterium]